MPANGHSWGFNLSESFLIAGAAQAGHPADGGRPARRARRCGAAVIMPRSPAMTMSVSPNLARTTCAISRSRVGSAALEYPIATGLRADAASRRAGPSARPNEARGISLSEIGHQRGDKSLLHDRAAVFGQQGGEFC